MRTKKLSLATAISVGVVSAISALTPAQAAIVEGCGEASSGVTLTNEGAYCQAFFASVGEGQLTLPSGVSDLFGIVVAGGGGVAFNGSGGFGYAGDGGEAKYLNWTNLADSAEIVVSVGAAGVSSETGAATAGGSTTVTSAGQTTFTSAGGAIGGNTFSFCSFSESYSTYVGLGVSGTGVVPGPYVYEPPADRDDQCEPEGMPGLNPATDVAAPDLFQYLPANYGKGGGVYAAAPTSVNSGEGASVVVTTSNSTVVASPAQPGIVILRFAPRSSTRECSTSTSNIRTSAGSFDLAGVELCFDQGNESASGPFSRQVSDADDFGDQATQGWSFEYKDVAVGADKTLNALLTVSAVSQLLDNEIDYVDSGSNSSNKWIKTGIDYLAAEADRYLEYTMVFYDQSDLQKSPVTVANLSLTVYDIDHYQFFESTRVKSYLLSSDTFLTWSQPVSGSLRIAEANGAGSSSSDDESRVTVKLLDSNEFKFKLGVSSLDPTEGGASYGLDFSGGPAWAEAPADTTLTPSYSSDSGPSLTYRSVLFDSNGGTVTTHLVSSDATFTLPAHALLKPGFVFTSWNTKANGTGIAYFDKGTYTFNSDVTLYAQWVPVKAAVKVKQYISTFAGDRATLTTKMKTTIAGWVKKLPKNAVITCQGSTSGSKVTAFDKRLASNRAKNVCVEAVKRRADLTYSIKLNPSSATKVSARHVWMIQN